MKKQYLLCGALLLSAPYAQYANAMQGQRIDPAMIAQIIDQIDRRQQPTPAEIEFFNRVFIDSLGQRVQPALPVQEVNQGQQLEQRVRAEQNRPLTPAERGVINQIADNLESYPNFVQRLHDAGILEQFLQQAQEIPAAQPAAQVEQEQVQQLTDRQVQILEAFKQSLSNLDDNNIQVMLIDANTDPLALANDDFMNVLTNEQRALLQEFIAITFDAQEVQQPAPVRNVQAMQQEQPILTEVEYQLIAQLEQELAPLGSNNINAVLAQAYINPSVLVQSPVLEQVLSDRQKEFVNNLLEMYAQRIISQQN